MKYKIHPVAFSEMLFFILLKRVKFQQYMADLFSNG